MSKRRLLEILGLVTFATGIGTLVSTAFLVASVLLAAAGAVPPVNAASALETILGVDLCLLVMLLIARYTRLLLR